MLIAGKGADQHDQGALRQVEVGNQAIQHLELVARIDKDVGVARLLVQRQTLTGSQCFQRAAAGGTHSNHPSALLFGLIDEVGGALRQIIMLRVHLVVGDFVLLDRTEGSQTDMEGHSGDVDPLGPPPFPAPRRVAVHRRR